MSDPNNPYVGPRAFLEHEKLFGRDDEICRLFDLLLAERIVLLYSPSGAGKTSLVQAGVVPKMRAEDFDVFPGIRVNSDPPPGMTIPPGFNRYAFSVMDSIERRISNDPIAKDLASRRIADFFAARFPKTADLAKPVFFHFDQFEEVLTLDPTDTKVKTEFFYELGNVLRDPRFFALFAMREEMVAAIEPYAAHLPTRLQNRFRLNFLAPAPAELAIRKPAEAKGVTFSAAPQIVEELSLVQITGADGRMGKVPGPFIEPVQLQVVCRSLWNKPRAKPDEISESDKAGVADVDSALGEFYDDCVGQAVAVGKANERQIREWIGNRLITTRGVRAQVLHEQHQSSGLDNEVIAALRDDHLIRSEERRGQIWYELAHDRLVEPIRHSNLRWFQQTLNPFQTRALEWDAAGRKMLFLLRDADLVNAEQWASASAAELTAVENAFLNESRAALTPFERLVIDWELEGRKSEMLPRGPNLDAMAEMASRKPRLSPSESAFLTMSRDVQRLERRIRIRERVAQAGAVLVVLSVIAAIWWVRERDREAIKHVLAYEAAANKEIAKERRDAQAARNEASIAGNFIREEYAADPVATAAAPTPITQIVHAQREISELALAAPAPSQTVIRYYQKPRDTQKLAEALYELGFEVQTERTRTENPTNCIWYAPDVPEEHVKLVAFAAIRAGIELQGIQAMKEPQPGQIHVGNYPFLADDPPLTVAEVQKTPLPALHRAPAVQKLGQRGAIAMFEPGRGEGTIRTDVGEVFFRTFGSGAQYESGQPVEFDLYTGKRRNYAVNVRPVAVTPPSELRLQGIDASRLRMLRELPATTQSADPRAAGRDPGRSQPTRATTRRDPPNP